VTGAWLALGDEVRDALARGTPVVALESSLIAQGLPAPHNLETARAAEAAIRTHGAVPATTAIDGGRVIVGAEGSLLERLADPDARAVKAGSRDLGPLLASAGLASTTVSATIRIAHAAGIAVMATGGIGGVHRGAERTFDVSADIDELATTPVAVVCSGAKSILDLPATMELLESRRVPVVGLGTAELPAFYSGESGLPLAHVAASAAEAARFVAAHRSVPGSAGILLVQPPPESVAIPAPEVDAWIGAAQLAAESEGVRGAAVTPYLLARVVAASDGRALRANIGLIVANAGTAAEVAVGMGALS
jgi:pseudouridine-5'-phosphate glycosidase